MKLARAIAALSLLCTPALAMQRDDDPPKKRQPKTGHGNQHFSQSKSDARMKKYEDEKKEFDQNKGSMSKAERKKASKKLQNKRTAAQHKEGPHNQGGGKGQNN